MAMRLDPISIWFTNEKALKPGLAEIIELVGEEYAKARPGTMIKSAHVGMAASNTYVLLTEVLPLAIRKYGGFNADALRSAARRSRSICRKAAPCSALGSSLAAKRRAPPARMSEHFRLSSNTSMTNHT
jgi:hypothetical protein